jgi:hypothetical protein
VTLSNIYSIHQWQSVTFSKVLAVQLNSVNIPHLAIGDNLECHEFPQAYTTIVALPAVPALTNV